MMLDTSYVIDLLRERHERRVGNATAFLQRHRAEKLRISVFTRCELQLGVERSAHPERERQALETLQEYIEPVYPSGGFSLIYAKTVAKLLDLGTPIPVMDTLIAATALQHAEPLVTNDADHFSRVEDLVILGY